MKNLIQAVIVAGLVAATIGTAAARSSFTHASPSINSTGPYSGTPYGYGGGQHTGSHGGYYAGGVGSSHVGGTYQNPMTGNQYGTHQ